MQVKRWLIPASVGVVVVIFGAIAVTLGLQASRGGPGDQYAFPIRWTAAMPSEGTPWANSSIELSDDGAATLVDVSVGELRKDDHGESCVSAPPDLFSGAAKWTITREGLLRLDTERGEALFLPWPGRFEGVDWGSMRQPLCNGDAVDYGARTPRTE